MVSFTSPRPKPCALHARLVTHIKAGVIVKQEKTIFNDPGGGKGQNRKHGHEAGRGERGSCRAQGLGFTSKPARSATQGKSVSIPAPAQGRAAKRLRTAWYFLGDRAAEGSQRPSVSHVEPPAGTELWVLVTVVRV